MTSAEMSACETFQRTLWLVVERNLRQGQSLVQQHLAERFFKKKTVIDFTK
jgi:hypothetical protein